MASDVLLYRNGNTVYVTGFTATADGSVKTDATWSFTAYDQNLRAISGATNITMTGIGGGEYRGVVAHTVQLTLHTVARIIAIETTYGCRVVADYPVEERTPRS